MHSKLIVLLGILCAIAVTVGTWFAIPKVHYQAHGIFLPAKTYTTFTGSPAQTVFLLPRFPRDYQALGTINIEQHFDGHHRARIQKDVLDLARNMAAKHGATAIVVTQAFFDNPKGVEAGLGALHFQGIAIKVPQVTL